MLALGTQNNPWEKRRIEETQREEGGKLCPLLLQSQCFYKFPLFCLGVKSISKKGNEAKGNQSCAGWEAELVSRAQLTHRPESWQEKMTLAQASHAGPWAVLWA